MTEFVKGPKAMVSELQGTLDDLSCASVADLRAKFSAWPRIAEAMVKYYGSASEAEKPSLGTALLARGIGLKVAIFSRSLRDAVAAGVELKIREESGELSPSSDNK